ncbi:hypothetical protein SK803_23930 [Lentzea sp. BCCO 10_0856]|uniref:Uncharacterized protein n=1 Tax=Lentzea miocenica TaxID=3095431 RepID=A0ABU4T5B9_9PSEU|nr:hypothetical protein [Lentzea sp. BCCO 10_0856]MDX8033279.1 hypothetical protein [Lentzea sp. BCCO 10_0856]
MADPGQPRFSADPTNDAVRRKLLQKLSINSKSPALAEMARELLAGRITPREVMTSSSYASALEPGVAQFQEWYGGLSDEQRAEQEELGRAALDRLAGEPETPPARTRRQNPPEGYEDEDFSDRSWLT